MRLIGGYFVKGYSRDRASVQNKDIKLLAYDFVRSASGIKNQHTPLGGKQLRMSSQVITQAHIPGLLVFAFPPRQV